MQPMTPFWLDEPYEGRPPLDGDAHYDVAVIGAGIGGMSTAWHLAGHGIRALVLDAGTVAGGASGRNGGFLIAGPASFYNESREHFGRDVARRMYAATCEAQTTVRGLAAELGAGDAIRQVGSLRLAVDEAEAAHTRAQVEALREDGFEAAFVEHDELPRELQRAGRAGCFISHDCGMHPARWVRAFARGAEARGARIVESTAVQAPVEAGAPLATPYGRVHAGRVVVAADGALGRLVPHYADAVRCRRLHMVATAPVGDEYTVEPVVYPRWGYEYYQRLPDGRMTLGGLGDVDAANSFTEREEASAEIHAGLERYLREQLGVTAPVTHRWIGLVGYSSDQRPVAGEVPGSDGRLYALGGYSGSGNLNGFVAGRIVADLIATGRSDDADLFDAARTFDGAAAW